MNQRGLLDPTIFLSPTFWLGALIVALSLSNVLFYNLYQGATDDLANFKSSVEAQQEATRADNERKLAERDKINADTTSGWASAVAYLREHPTVRVLPAHCDSRAGPAAPEAARRPDEAAAQQGFGSVEVSAAQCQERLINAAEDAMQLLWLQDWVMRQVEVK